MSSIKASVSLKRPSEDEGSREPKRSKDSVRDSPATSSLSISKTAVSAPSDHDKEHSTASPIHRREQETLAVESNPENMNKENVAFEEAADGEDAKKLLSSSQTFDYSLGEVPDSTIGTGDCWVDDEKDGELDVSGR